MYILGVEVDWSKCGTVISQWSSSLDLLKDNGMLKARPAYNPILVSRLHDQKPYTVIDSGLHNTFFFFGRIYLVFLFLFCFLFLYFFEWLY